MRRLGLALVALCALAMAVAVLVLAAALQSEPAVTLRDGVSHQDVARVMGLLRWHDPRRNRPGRPALARLDERDLEVLVGHGAQHWLRAATRVSLLRGGARVQLSVHLPANPFGSWLNVDVRLAETGGLPAIEHSQVGRLPVPARLAATSLKLKPLPPRESATSLYRPMACDRGPVPSAANAADTRKCRGRSSRPPSITRRRRALGQEPAAGAMASTPRPLANSVSTSRAARFSAAASAPAAVRCRARSNNGPSRRTRGTSQAGCSRSASTASRSVYTRRRCRSSTGSSAANTRPALSLRQA